MNLLFKRYTGTCTDVAPLVLRLALGAIFVAHGYMKFSGGLTSTSTFMESLGLPLPTLMAFLVTYGELVGGIFLVLGLMTYWTSVVYIIISVVALLMVHIGNGFWVNEGGYEFIMLILAGSISMFFTGAGKYSLDAKISKETPTAPI